MEALKKYLENKDWKYFENFISEVLERFEYKVEKNVRLKFLNYKEFDLIAKKQKRVLLIECKRWKREYAKYKRIKKEIEKFKEKIENFKRYQFFSEKVFGIIIFLDSTFQPIIEDNIFVISLDYLNELLNEIENLYF